MSSAKNDCLQPSHASALLARVFGVDCAIYQRQRDWTRLAGCCPVFDAQPEKLSDTESFAKPLTRTLPDESTIIIMPVPWFDVCTVGVGVVPATMASCVDRLIQVAGQLLHQEQQLQLQNDVMDELIQRVEENAWLRQMAELIEFCEARQSVREVAQSILPRLKKIVAARNVAFLPAPDSGLAELWCGERRPPTLAALLDQYRLAAERQPVVLNAHAEEDEREWGLRSFVLVRVGVGKREYGWLVAIDSENAGLIPQSAEVGYSESEFGTMEAGLLRAAASLLATHARNVELFRAREELTLGVIRSMVKAIDARDRYTHGHSDRVAIYAREIAQAMGLEQRSCEKIYLTGLLHDVGKIGVPDAVLKKNGKLTEEEFAIIQRHPDIGHDILASLKPLSYVLPGVRHHHERPDGRGYPCGLTGEEMPLEARILGVADAYDAMTSSRAYRKCMSFEKAEQIVRENVGRQFDEEAVEAFFNALPRIRAIAEADTSRRINDGDGTYEEVSACPPELRAEIDTAVFACHDA